MAHNNPHQNPRRRHSREDNDDGMGPRHHRQSVADATNRRNARKAAEAERRNAWMKCVSYVLLAFILAICIGAFILVKTEYFGSTQPQIVNDGDELLQQHQRELQMDDAAAGDGGEWEQGEFRGEAVKYPPKGTLKMSNVHTMLKDMIKIACEDVGQFHSNHPWVDKYISAIQTVESESLEVDDKLQFEETLRTLTDTHGENVKKILFPKIGMDQFDILRLIVKVITGETAVLKVNTEIMHNYKEFVKTQGDAHYQTIDGVNPGRIAFRGIGSGGQTVSNQLVALWKHNNRHPEWYSWRWFKYGCGLCFSELWERAEWFAEHGASKMRKERDHDVYANNVMETTSYRTIKLVYHLMVGQNTPKHCKESESNGEGGYGYIMYSYPGWNAVRSYWYRRIPRYPCHFVKKNPFEFEELRYWVFGFKHVSSKTMPIYVIVDELEYD